MKKRNPLYILLFVLLLFGNSNNYRLKEKKYLESGFASDYGFDIKNLKFETEYEAPLASISGDRYFYNSLYQWSGIYSYFDEAFDSKYYFVLTHTKLTTNSNSLLNGYYRIVSKYLKIKYKANLYVNNSLDNSYLRLIKYCPEQYGSSSTSTEMGFNVGLNASGSLSTSNSSLTMGLVCGVGASVTVFKDSVIMTPTSSNMNEVLLDYVFQNTYVKKTNNLSPYRGDFIQNTIALFKVLNYSNCKGGNIIVDIDTEGNSQKFSVGAFVCTGHETKSSFQNKSYCLSI